MALNGHLDISTLIDWDGRGNYLTPEASRQWLAWRLAVYQETGEWMFTSEAYRPEGQRGDLAAGNYNTQWYWWEWYDGDSRFAARPGTTSAHGLASAVDIISTVYGSNGNSDMHRKIERLGRLHGWVFDIPNEPWHAHYIGNPDIVAPIYPRNTPTTNKKEDDEVTTFKGMPSGNIFTITPEYIHWYDNAFDPAIVAIVTTVEDVIQEVSDADVPSILRGFGVDARAIDPLWVRERGWGDTWSRGLEISSGISNLLHA